MPTSGAPSRVPPNQAAARRPGDASTMVEAWHCGYGAFSFRYSVSLIAGCGAAPVMPSIDAAAAIAA